MSSNLKYQLVSRHEIPIANSLCSVGSKIVSSICNKKVYAVVFLTCILSTVFYIALVTVTVNLDTNTTWHFMETDKSSRDNSFICDGIFPKRLGNVSKPELLKMLHECERYIFQENFETNTSSHSDSTKAFTVQEFETESLPNDRTMACHIPRLNPWDPSIKAFVEEPEALNCEDEYPLVFNSTFNSTIVPGKLPGKIKSYGIKHCCYQVVTRQDESKTDYLDDSYEFSDTCYPVSLESETIISPEHDHIAIKCKHRRLVKSKKGTKKTFKTFTKVVDMHTFIHLKPEVEERVEKFTKSRLSKRSSLPKDRLNVVILGIDGVSHMNFIRVMPSSYRFLMSNMSAVEMNGVNKVGDNTFPNMAAALAGVKLTVKKTLPCEVDDSFDECPMIWKKYAQNGYRTAYGEDAAWMSGFNYLKNGFNTIPTDYYFRPFAMAADDIIGTHEKLNAKLCYGPRMQFDVVLNYLQKMAYTMGHDKRYFQLMWSNSLTHDDLNEGKLGDQSLLSTLEWFQDQGYLNNTMFILMSDHGIRYGDILDTPAGKLELKMPFLFFISPSWFKEKYSKAYENLKRNSHRLTTPFDLHQTLHDLVNLDILTNEALSKRELWLASAVSNGKVPRGISQFLPIPVSRTCSTAGIPHNYCICHQSTPLPVNNSTVLQAANYAVYYMNSLLSSHKSCSYLSLAKVKSAQFVVDSDSRNKAAYQISFETAPGGGRFDASLIISSEGFWQVSGTIGRTNLYGNQSHCVNNKEMKLYCYCVDLM